MIVNLEKYSTVIISLVILIELIVTILTIKHYKKIKKDTLYSYSNVSYLGGIIFHIFILLFLVIMAFIRSNLEDRLLSFIADIANITTYFLLFTLPLAFIFFIFMVVSNISLLKHEGKRIFNMLGSFFSLWLLLGIIVMFLGWDLVYLNIIRIIYNYGFRWITIADIAIPLFINGLICYLECILVGVIIYNIKAIKVKPSYDKDYVIILGCGISKDGTPLPLLKSRIDRAIEFYKEQIKNNGKEIIFICSGGQGSNEVVSEGLSMKNYLLSKGIKENNILVDDKSINTLENMKFSKKLINKKIDNNVIYSTNNYHVFRAGIYANMVELKAEGIGSKTKWYFWPNAFIREFIALLSNNKRTHGFNAIIMLILSVIVGYVYYIFV